MSGLPKALDFRKHTEERMPVVAALLALALASPTPAPAGGTASGTFEDKTWKLKLSGAYAFWDKTHGSDEARRIRVAVSNSGFVKDAFDEHYDRERAINTLFADDETKVVYLELDESGGYHGLSYYFGSGSGCGYCFSTEVKNTVKPKNGRLQGRLAYKDDSFDFDVTLDVPIPPKQWGEPLPKDGGAPGKVFLAYASALEARDPKRIYALLDAENKEHFQKYEKDGQLEDWLSYLWKEEHTELKTIRVTGGFVRGDRAVVLFDGSNAYIEKLHGEAVLRREGGAWLIHRDMVEIGSR
jgi:hypothetical protein